jgi:DNA helicase-2/ATP-dependent DNA helicase PcrA
MHDLLAHLNTEQRRAVVYEDGPLLVLAGPGAGKTRVIVHRIAFQIAAGIPARRLLAVTFTNRAAEEMKERVRGLLAEGGEVRIGTFHWVAHALLRRYGDRAGYRRDFRLLTPSEARRALADASALPAVESSRLSAAISAVKNGESVETAAKRAAVGVNRLREVHEVYDRALKRAGVVELDDLLPLAVRLLREHDDIGSTCRAAYAEVLVDEYQDTNPVQQELLRLLVPANSRVVAVGDEDQSIYAWRQADARAMRRFLEDFPDAEVVRLQTSYRSTKRILRAAGSLISQNPDRLGLSLRTDNRAGEPPVCFVAEDEVDEAEWITSEIEQVIARGVVAADVAVLYRVNAQARAIEDALVRHNIGYHVRGGERFYDLPEVRTTLAYLRLALDRDDAAALYLAATVRGVGRERLQRLVDAAREGDLLDVFRETVPGIPREVCARLNGIGGRVQRVRSVLTRTVAEAVDLTVSLVRDDFVDNPSSDLETVTENLNELRAVAREFGARRAGLGDFLDRLSLGSSPDRRAGVALMTVHAAKGLEFDVVFVPGVEEGLLPHRRSLECEEGVQEERRLAYVAMTRAKRQLYLSYAHMRLLGGSALLGEPSRFIGEIGHDNLALRLSPRGEAKPRLLSVKVGERVSHPRWDAGTVVAVEGRGRDTLVSIAFDTAGTQRLQLCHAPLRRIAEADAVAG